MTATSRILRGDVRGVYMTEDELLQGIAEALTFGGWVWTHIRRSDRITVGNVGDVRVIRPIQYDAALAVIILGADPAMALDGIA